MDTAEAAQRIASAVAPAVMVSACGLLALGLDNQAARMTGRLRDLAKEHRVLPGGHPRGPALRKETRVLARRHGLYTVALMCNYGALLAFLLTSVTALYATGGRLHALALWLFAGGVLLLASMAISALLAVRLSRRAIVVEEREVLTDALPPDSRLG